MKIKNKNTTPKGAVSSTPLTKSGISPEFFITSKWVLENFFPKLSMSELERCWALWNQWIITKGPKWTIARLKFLRLSLIRLLSGTPLKREPFVAYFGKTLLPKGLPWREGILANDLDSIRGALSLLEFNKCIKYWDKPTYKSIIEPSTFNDEKLSEDIVSVIRDLNLDSVLSEVKWESYHYSAKAGPNGPALGSALNDFLLLDINQKKYIKTLGGDLMSETIDNLSSLFQGITYSDLNEYVKRKDGIQRKISIIRDPENKVRPIAIFDYWSQSVLKPIHDTEFRILKKFKSDKTFSQRRVTPGKENYCFDLSSATDRFPVKLQKIVLRELFGCGNKAEAWEYLMVNKEFLTEEGNSIKYNCGQPMGAYSSWSTFTICHHLVVQLALKRSGIKPSLNNDDYALLGDDIVIFNKNVAAHYKSIINTLGVEISETKTTESKDFMEFAKTYHYLGENVTPFHIHGLVNTYNGFDTLCGFINNLVYDGWDVSSITVKQIKDLLVRLGKSKRYSSRQASLISIYKDLHLYINDPKDYIDKPYIILRKSGMYWSCNSWLTQAPKYLLEVCASHKLLSLQNSFIDGTKEINMAVRAHMTTLASLGIPISQENLNLFPIVSTLIQKQRYILEEVQTFEGTASGEKDWLQIFKEEYSFLPSPTLAISLKPRNTNGRSVIKSQIQKVVSFLIQEAKDLEDLG